MIQPADGFCYLDPHSDPLFIHLPSLIIPEQTIDSIRARFRVLECTTKACPTIRGQRHVLPTNSQTYVKNTHICITVRPH